MNNFPTFGGGEQPAGKMAELPNPPVCPIGNICAASTAGAPLCGSVREHLNPLVLSEDLCPDLADRQVALERSLITRPLMNQQMFFLGSALFDRGLGWDAGEPDAGADFDEGEAILGKVVNQTSRNMERQFKSSLILAHAPLFRGRQADDMTPEQMQRTRMNLADVGDRIDKYDISERSREGMGMRLAACHLILRCGMAHFPSLAREGQNRSRPFLRLNHSGYMYYGPKLPKTPIRTSPGRPPKEPVLHASLERIFEPALRIIPQADERNLSTSPNAAFRALQAEARNEPVPLRDMRLLDALSASLLGQIVKHERACSIPGPGS